MAKHRGYNLQRSCIRIAFFVVFYLTSFSPLFSQPLQPPAAQNALEQRFSRALRHIGASRYDSAVVILEQIVTENPTFQAAYRKLADACILADQIETTREKFTRIVQNDPDNAYAYYLLARLDFQQKRYDEALEKLKLCIQKKPDFSDAYGTSGGLPEIFHAQNDFAGGKRFFTELIARQPDNAFAYYGLGRLLAFENQWDQAEKQLKKSLALLPLQYEAYNTLQYIYENLGDYKKSIRNSQQLLQVAFQMNSLELAANALIRQGGMKFRLGNLRSALEDMIKGVIISRQIGVKKMEGLALLNAGTIYATLGNYDKALEYFNQALSIVQVMKVQRNEIRILMNIGLLKKDTGDYPEALQYLQMALERSQSDAYLYERGNISVALAETVEKLGRFSEAVTYYEKALSIFEKFNSEGDLGYTLVRMGDVYFQTGKYQPAVQHYLKALHLGKRIDDAQIIWESRAGLGASYEKLGQTEPAIENYRLAIASYDSIRQNLDIETLTQSFLDDKYQVYPSLVHLLAKSQQYAEAFRYTELYKAKNLLQILSKGQIAFNELLPDTVKFELIGMRDRLAEVRNRYARELEKPRDQQDANQLLLLDQKITELELKKSDLIRRIREKYPEFYQLTSAKPVTIPQLQQEILQGGQLLIEYLVGPEITSVFAITPDTVMYRFIPLQRDSLGSMISAMSRLFRIDGKGEETGQIIGPDQADFSIPPAYRLARVLFDPIQPLLEKCQELIIVPDDILYYVPFEALVTDTSQIESRYDFANATFLIQSKVVSYSSSASVLSSRFEQAVKPRRRVLALGNPAFVSNAKGERAADGLRGTLMPLPHSETEVRAVGRLLHAFRGDVLTGERATETAFAKKAGDYQILHVASHFVVNDREPMYSRLAFSEEKGEKNDGFLHTYEIFSLKLHAALVTLSACNTALGKLSKGEGLIGMSRAFLTAGVPSLVVSLWSVDDDATSRIMENFYANLARGMPKNRALQLAKMDYLHAAADAHKDPYYWAPFILMGDLQPISLLEEPFEFARYAPVVLSLLLLLGSVFWVYHRRRGRVRIPSN